MKRVLITGEKSYVGTQLEKWLSQWPNEFIVTKISVRNQDWEQMDFSEFDVIVHTAALVHKKETLEMRDEYFHINSDLTFELAVKAKEEGVKHFIFLSSISVYGLEGEIGKSCEITNETPLNPKSLYGISKVDAENRIRLLQDEGFYISIVRAPMIYGLGCPGNYEKLRKLILKLHVFPHINNQRSVIFSDHLSEFIRIIIRNEVSGLFHPQNNELFSTVDAVTEIAKLNNKRIVLLRGFNFILKGISKHTSIVNKLFGNLTIDYSLSNGEFGYSLYSFKDTAEKSEQGSLN